MALAKFVKIRIYGWSTVKEELIAQLQKLGIIEITAPPSGEAADKPADETTDKKLSMVDFCLGSFSGLMKKGLFESFFPSRLDVAPKDYIRAVNDFPLEEVFNKCRARDEKSRELNSEHAKLKAEYNKYLPWAELQVKPVDLYGARRLGTAAFRINRKVLGAFREKIGDYGFVSEIKSSRTVAFCVGGYLREEAERFNEALREFKGEITDLSAGEYLDNLTPGQIAGKIKNRLDAIEEEKTALLEETGADAGALRELMILSDHFENIRDRRSAGGNFQWTGTVFFFDGWIKEKKVPALNSFLDEKFPDAAVELIRPDEKETPPVELDNPGAVRPFEAITDLYGMPGSKELDPTPYLAPFFALFFAICMTDAGYGILLVIFSALLRKKIKPAGQALKFMNLLIVTGFATIVFGALTGGMFGIQPEQFPARLEFLKNLREKVMLFDPMEQFLVFMLVALGLGFLQVWFGYLVKLIQGIRAGMLKSALGAQMPWLIILPGLLLLGIARNPETVLLGLADEPPLGGNWDFAARIMVYSGTAGMFLQPGGGRNVLKRAGAGIYSLYGIIGCLGDVLSYVRLFALGLATVAMAIAINTMAGMAAGIPVIGLLAGAVIAVVGHTANLAINALSAFIHTVRLQFVEFFTRFYQGGGRSFRPFSCQNRFIEIQNGGKR